jgi:hypothetical protein
MFFPYKLTISHAKILTKPYPPPLFSTNSTVAPTAPTAAWTLKSNSYLGLMASDKNFTKVIKNFMKETSRKRSKTILNNTAGSYVYSGGRLRHVLLCNDVSLCLDGSGDDKDYMLSNSSSGFGIMRPCVISMTEVGATILYFVRESSIPAEIKDAYHVGTPFVKATVAAASLSAYFPTGEETTPHVLVSVPANLPIDGGMTLASGVVEDDVYQTLQVSHGNYGKFYLDAMVSHDVALQAAAGTNKATLRDHYPNRNATGTVVIPDSNITITYTTPDMEDTLGSELVGLQRRMPIDPGASPNPGAGIPTNILAGADTQSGNYKTTAMLAPFPCRKRLLANPLFSFSHSTNRDGPGPRRHAKADGRGEKQQTPAPHPMPILHGNIEGCR